MADPRAPGIYQSYEPVAPPPMAISDTRVAGFVGFSGKGPMNEPTRLATWDEFVEQFGTEGDHYLASSVRGFFRNGGRACWVVRVAHCVPAAPAGDVPGPDHANCASLDHPDSWKKPTLRIRALDEGAWGNSIWFSCQHTTGAKALLTRDIDVGAGEAQLSTTRGFEIGALLKIYDRENADYVVITEVGDKAIKWSTSTPMNRKHRAAAPTYVEVLSFELHVALRDRREVFKGLQMHPTSRSYAPRVVSQRSRLVRAEDLKSTSPVPHNLPQVQALTRLMSGRDGLDLVTPEDVIGHDHGPADRAGMLALASLDEIALLACPDAMKFYERERGPAGELKSQRLQDQLISICELQKDRFAILDIPQSKDIEWVRRWRRRTESSYGAYYWPWLRAESASGDVRALPPSGFMAGVYAQRDTTDGVHQAPANLGIVGAEDVSLRVNEDHLGILNADAVNTFRIQRGVRPWGARTASSDPQWRYITTRRLFIMLRRSLEAGYAWATFEPNNQQTWDLVRSRTEAFLADLLGRGMLAGGNADEAFFVKCDAELNEADNVDAGILACEIGIAPVSPAEFIMITMTQTLGSPT